MAAVPKLCCLVAWQMREEGNRTVWAEVWHVRVRSSIYASQVEHSG